MPDVRYIKFVGKDAHQTDTVAGTGTYWPEPGAVMPVPVLAAAKLVRHDDTWEDVTDDYIPDPEMAEVAALKARIAELEAELAARRPGETGSPPMGADVALAPPRDLGSMNKAGLIQYAQRELMVDPDPKMSKAELIHMIQATTTARELAGEA